MFGWIEKVTGVPSRRTLRRELAKAKREARRAERRALTDDLTGLRNRQHWTEQTESMMRNGRQFSVVLFDVGNLKSANAVYGQFGANELLRKIAQKIRKRGDDKAIRMGGDEFALILPDTSVAVARVVRDRLEQDVGFLELRPDVSMFLVGTCSEWVPGMSERDLFEQLTLADLRLKERNLAVKRSRNEATTRAAALESVAAQASYNAMRTA